MPDILVAAGFLATPAGHILRVISFTSANRTVVDRVRPHVVSGKQPTGAKLALHRSLPAMEAGDIVGVLAIDQAEVGKRPLTGQRVNHVDICSCELMVPVTSDVSGVEDETGRKRRLNLESPLADRWILAAPL